MQVLGGAWEALASQDELLFGARLPHGGERASSELLCSALL